MNQTSSTEWQQISKFTIDCPRSKSLQLIGNQQQKFQLIGSQIKKFTIDWNKINNVVIDWQPYQKTDHKKNHSLKIMRNNLTFSSKIEKCSREHKPKYRLKAFIFINSFC